MLEDRALGRAFGPSRCLHHQHAGIDLGDAGVLVGTQGVGWAVAPSGVARLATR